MLGCVLLQRMLDGFAEVIERAFLVEEGLSLAAAGRSDARPQEWADALVAARHQQGLDWISAIAGDPTNGRCPTLATESAALQRTAAMHRICLKNSMLQRGVRGRRG
jgi:hypothetical protein